jgi:hypothetical protein
MSDPEPFDPLSQPLWASDKSLDFAFRAALPAGIQIAALTNSAVTTQTPELALRTSLICIAEQVTNHQRHVFVCQDDAQTVCISIDVLDAARAAPSLAISGTLEKNLRAELLRQQREQIADTASEFAPVPPSGIEAAAHGPPGPIVPVRFLVGQKSSPALPQVLRALTDAHGKKVKNLCGASLMLGNTAVQVKCNIDELALLEDLLVQNAALVSAKAQAEFKAHPLSHGGMYKLSFLNVLPIPHTVDNEPEPKTQCCAPGCAAEAPNKCAGCNGAFYCSRECQVSHWAVHKKDCARVDKGASTAQRANSAGDAQSVVISFAATDEYALRTIMSFKTGATSTKKSGIPGRNTHGSGKFLVKVQVPLQELAGTMLIYDETRKTQAFSDDAALQAAMARLAPRQPKAYLWAVREGDSLRIFTDKIAAPPPRW